VESWCAEGSKDAGNKEVVGNSHELRRVEGISERGQDFMNCRAMMMTLLFLRLMFKSGHCLKCKNEVEIYCYCMLYVQADFISRNFCFQLENLHCFSDLHDNFQSDAIWHR